MSGLLRVVSRWEIVALSVNDVIGSGVYLILPVAAAALLGPASIFAILGAGLAVLVLVLCFAEAGSMFDKPGGAYVYTRAAFGDFFAFEIGWMSCLAGVSSVAGLSFLFARAVGFLIPAANEGIGKWVTTMSTLLILTAVNVGGVKSGARTAVVLTWGKVIPLALFAVVGVFFLKGSHLAPITMPPVDKIGTAALLVLFAYSGFENTAAPAGEFKNPKKDIPFALIVTILLVTAIYTLVQLVAIGSVDGIGSSPTPLAAGARVMLGPIGGFLLTLGAALSVLGTINNTILTGPRYLYALAERGVLPSFFAKIHPKFHTPYVAILTHVGIAAGLMLSGTAEQLAELSAIARLASYIGTSAAVPVLRKKMPNVDRLRLPGGPLVPILSLCICILFVSSATAKNLVSAAIALAVGAVIFAVRRGSLSPVSD